MSIRSARLVPAALIVQLLGTVALLSPIPLLLSRSNATFAQQVIDLQHIALWIGPSSGFVLCLLAGWWVARGRGSTAATNGLSLGIAAALLDVAMLLGAGAPVGVLVVGSPLARLAGGLVGGRISRWRSMPAQDAIGAAGGPAADVAGTVR